MIEALVAYIEGKGWHVYVFPGVLIVREIVSGQLAIGFSWAISQWELAHVPKWLLFDQADRRLAELQRVIDEARRNDE